MRVFQRFSSVEVHLSFEKCSKSLERKSLLDLAKTQYASLLEECVGKIPTLIPREPHETEETISKTLERKKQRKHYFSSWPSRKTETYSVIDSPKKKNKRNYRPKLVILARLLTKRFGTPGRKQKKPQWTKRLQWRPTKHRRGQQQAKFQSGTGCSRHSVENHLNYGG